MPLFFIFQLSEFESQHLILQLKWKSSQNHSIILLALISIVLPLY